MFLMRFKRNMRTLVFLVVTGAVVLCPVGLWWANRTGLVADGD
jgi:hypothetical protein